MLRLIFGLVKGAILGAAAGLAVYGAGQAGVNQVSSLPLWVVYGAVGFIVGLLVGRPFWSHFMDKESTIWTSIMKGLVGFGVGAGVWALVAKVSPNPVLTYQGVSRSLSDWQPLFGAAIGALYGAWVELDDPAKPKAAAAKS